MPGLIGDMSKWSKLGIVVAVIVVLGLADYWYYVTQMRAVMAPYNAAADAAQFNTIRESSEIDAIAEEMQASSPDGKMSASDRLAVSQAQLAVEANRYAHLNYSAAENGLFAAFSLGHLQR
jgi:hypothetical protein